MPVHGLVLTLSPDPDAARRARLALEAERAITLGPAQGHKQPVVIETTDLEEETDLWAWLGQLEGVGHHDLVFSDFSDLDAVDSALLLRRRRRPRPVEG